MKSSTKLLIWALALMPLGIVTALKYRAESVYTFVQIGSPLCHPTRVIEILPDSIPLHRVAALRVNGVSATSLPTSHPAVQIFRTMFVPPGTPSPEADWDLVIGGASVFAMLVIVAVSAVSANRQDAGEMPE